MSDDRYQLIDFGEGRKLESVAGRWIDRPCPAAESRTKRLPERWEQAESRFETRRKCWKHLVPWPDDLTIDCGGFRMPVRPTPFGHIGVFPEQADNWRWLAEASTSPPLAETPLAETQLKETPLTETPLRGLNLFAYTGASTMALACGGYAVAHVDAAKPNVAAARNAARINGFGNHPIRYLVEDAAKFAAREIRRGRCYHTIVLDPPAYGHSGSGKAWRLQRDLWPLLDDCLRLLTPDSFRLLVTGHSPQVGAEEVISHLRRALSVPLSPERSGLRMQSGRSQLRDLSGRSLDAGFYVRIERPGPTAEACQIRPMTPPTD